MCLQGRPGTAESQQDPPGHDSEDGDYSMISSASTAKRGAYAHGLGHPAGCISALWDTRRPQFKCEPCEYTVLTREGLVSTPC